MLLVGEVIHCTWIQSAQYDPCAGKHSPTAGCWSPGKAMKLILGVPIGS